MFDAGELLLTFYGDDFTGSTDALESLARTGANVMLFMEPPTLEKLAQYPHLQAVGVAGMTRSMWANQIPEFIEPRLRALRALGAPHVHYKVCSTFDSSPCIGSIGKVMDVAAKVFDAQFIPLLVGSPALGRYCVFGNLFARFGGKGEVHRLDRHPSMGKHPITPAHESDLRLHLACQTDKPIGLFDILKLELPRTEAEAALLKTITDGAEIVLFDVLNEAQLPLIGALMDGYASREHPLFSVGSSAVENALCANWIADGQLTLDKYWIDLGPANPLLVASGSGSPVSESQIVWALEHGFVEVVLDIAALAQTGSFATVARPAIDAAINFLKKGRHVVLHLGKPKADFRVPETPEEINRIKSATESGAALGTLKEMEITRTGKFFGGVLGFMVSEIVRGTSVRRLCVAGGDTSGHIAKALGIEALEMIAPLAMGAPLCRAHAPGLPADGLQVVFKGGQVGNQDFFSAVQRGKL